MPLLRSVRVASICTAALAVGAVSVSALPTSARISHAGLGAIKLGMTERQVERAANRSITLSPGGTGCALATIAPKTQGLFTGRRLRRIYIQTPRFATKEGIRLGTTETRVLAAYPDMLVRVPQKFAPNEDDLVLRKDNRKIVFSLAGGKVSEISTGRTPEIDLVERCS